MSARRPSILHEIGIGYWVTLHTAWDVVGACFSRNALISHPKDFHEVLRNSWQIVWESTSRDLELYGSDSSFGKDYGIYYVKNIEFYYKFGTDFKL